LEWPSFRRHSHAHALPNNFGSLRNVLEISKLVLSKFSASIRSVEVARQRWISCELVLVHNQTSRLRARAEQHQCSAVQSTMSTSRRQKQVPSSGDKYYCKACKLYIADNRAQRLQHEGGAKHQAASAALVADISRRNKEAAAAAAVAKAERDALEPLVGRAPVPPAGVAAARQEMLLRAQTLAAPRPSGGVPEAIPEAERGEREVAGYGQWEEVADVDSQAVDGRKHEEGATSTHLKRAAPPEVRIGATDFDDEEEALAREATVVGKDEGDSVAGNSGRTAVVFKYRTARSNKRKRMAL
jgi:U1 zinc finger